MECLELLPGIISVEVSFVALISLGLIVLKKVD